MVPKEIENEMEFDENDELKIEEVKKMVFAFMIGFLCCFAGFLIGLSTAKEEDNFRIRLLRGTIGWAFGLLLSLGSVLIIY